MVVCRLYQPWDSPQYEAWTTAGEDLAFFLNRKYHIFHFTDFGLAGGGWRRVGRVGI
jgi:hypothetical protein